MIGFQAVAETHRRPAESSHQGETMHDRMRVLPRTLSHLRCEIDRIDDALLELVEARLSAARAVASAKTADGSAFLKLRPLRESQVVTRLAARARHVDPVLIREIWRALMAHGLQGQACTAIVLHASDERLALQDAVRMRFGMAAPLRWAAGEAAAIAAACDEEAVAVIVRDEAPAFEDAPAFGKERLVVFDTWATGNRTAYAIGRIAPEDRA